jgi:hypothetical protein
MQERRDNMTVSFKNFRGEIYYLHSKLTKKGNTLYHFSKKAEGAAEMDEVPDGFEIYEDPNGKVYLKKKTKPYILGDEIRLVEEGMKKHSAIKDFKLDIKKNVIYIYTVENSFEDATFPKTLVDEYKQYETSLRFILVDPDERRFEVERFCYLGEVDDWIYLDGPNELERLVREYVQYLGEESFYDLM